MPKQLVILAAGKGSRIRAGGSDTPKPLVKVGGIPLLKRTILTATKVGVERFVVILGYEAEEILAQLSTDAQLADFEIQWVTHDRYDLNNGVSVLQARPYVEGEFLLTMADHVVDPNLYRALGEAPLQGDLALAVDHKLDDVFDMDDATKVQVGRGGTIDAIAKQLDDFNAVDTGVFRCTPHVFDALDAVYQEHGNASLSEGVTRLADEDKAFVVDIGSSWWQDVDDLSTRAEAERRLFVSLTKSIDGPVSKHINRRFSKWVTRRIMNTSLTPNHMTTVGLIIGLLSAAVTACATQEGLWLIPLGGFLYQLSSMIDGCDGEVARLKFLSSDWGEWYDTISDDVINLSYQLALGYALFTITGQMMWLTISAIGVLLGTFVVIKLYQQLIREDAGTHLAISWSFEDDQTSIFQKICARCAFVARRDFYALTLMLFSFMGLGAIKFGLSLSLLTIFFIFGQWLKSALTANGSSEVKMTQPQLATGEFAKSS